MAANSPSTPQGLDKGDEPGINGTGAAESESADGADGDNSEQAGATYDFLAVIGVAEERDNAFKGAVTKARSRQAYDAWHSRHSEGSRYADARYKRRRSHVYRPRTRASVRKNMASIAASIFTSPDSVSVTAEITTDPVRAASASVLQQLLNYRLDRTSAQSGIPFFLVATGAAQDAQITGVCWSKQFWEFEQVDEETTETVVSQQYYKDTGQPVRDPKTGEHITDQKDTKKTQTFTTKDRPQSMNLPFENVIIDPMAYWINPEQRSAYLIIKYGMPEDEARTMLDNPGKGKEDWLEVSDAQLERVMEDYTSKGVRTARSGDRVDSNDNRGGSSTQPKSNVVWLYECFVRVAGVDYHFWSLGTQCYASTIRTTRQAYPEQRGERPVTRGVAQIETHETFPTAPVTTWLPLQRELNDIANMRLDTMKQALSPIAKVKQGTTFDFQALRERGGEGSTILVRSMEDLAFDRAPDVTSGAYQETEILNADFDDLAAVFQPSSVDTNRKMNETVGGMQLMQSSANSVGEFDTRTFMETWGEPTLRQVVRLEQYYESDENILAIAGARAKLEKWGVDQLTDSDLEHEVAVRVNAGLGSADPMQKMGKLTGAVKILAPMFPMMTKMVRIKPEETIAEVMGLAGYHDGLRFFEIEDGPPPPPPAVAKLQAQQATDQSREKIASNRDQANLKREEMREKSNLIQTILKQFGDKMDASNAAAAATPGNAPKPMTITANFKDLPPEAQADALAQDGIFIHPDTIAAANAVMRQPGAPAGVPHGPNIGSATSLMAALQGMLEPAPPPAGPAGAPPPGQGAGGPPGM